MRSVWCCCSLAFWPSLFVSQLLWCGFPNTCSPFQELCLLWRGFLCGLWSLSGGCTRSGMCFSMGCSPFQGLYLLLGGFLHPLRGVPTPVLSSVRLLLLGHLLLPVLLSSIFPVPRSCCLKCVFAEVPCVPLICLLLVTDGSVFVCGWSGCDQHRAIPAVLLHRSPLQVPPCPCQLRPLHPRAPELLYSLWLCQPSLNRTGNRWPFQSNLRAAELFRVVRCASLNSAACGERWVWEASMWGNFSSSSSVLERKELVLVLG